MEKRPEFQEKSDRNITWTQQMSSGSEKRSACLNTDATIIVSTVYSVLLSVRPGLCS